MTKRKTTPLHGGKPTAQRHAERREQKAKYDKPEFNPLDAYRWIDRNGRFTIPNTKGEK